MHHGFTIASDPDFQRDFSEIVDFSDVTELVISGPTLTKMAATPSLYSESVKHIIVAPTDQTFEVANRFKTLAGKTRRHLHVVRTRADAYKLLGIRPD